MQRLTGTFRRAYGICAHEQKVPCCCVFTGRRRHGRRTHCPHLLCGQRVTVYKTPTCGCCAKWVDHLEANGFRVKVVDLADVTPMKIRYGVPADLGSCHTALVSGYFVEGHVPAEEIHRMLETGEPIAGLAVPGMPMGSPGMEGFRSDPYDIVAVEKDGGRRIFASR